MMLAKTNTSMATARWAASRRLQVSGQSLRSHSALPPTRHSNAATINRATIWFPVIQPMSSASTPQEPARAGKGTRWNCFTLVMIM